MIFLILRKHGVPKEEKFQCDLCNSAFVTRFALKRHEKFKHKQSQIDHSIPTSESQDFIYELDENYEIDEEPNADTGYPILLHTPYATLPRDKIET